MDYYSSIAPGYDALYGEEQDEKLREFLAKTPLSDKALDNGMILDVGCGTARSKQFFPHMSWRGIEPAQGLIDHAPQDAKPLITTGGGESLPYPNDSFDIVLSLTALQNFDDPNAGLQEMNRVVKPDGIIVLSFLKKSEKKTVLARMVDENLHVMSAWESAKDMMFICARKN